MIRAPLSVQTAYQDLLQRHQVEPPVSVKGSIIKISKGGRGFWVERYRQGDKVRETALGPDNQETQVAVERALREKDAHKMWEREVSALVASLRGARCLSPDVTTSRVLQSVANTGFFEKGGILGGTHAFRFYPLELGMSPPDVSSSMTSDVDLIVPANLSLRAPSSLSDLIIRTGGLSVRPVFHVSHKKPLKYVFEEAVEVEILSSFRSGGETTHFHEGIGEQVQAMRFLEFSMIDPVEAVCLYRDGFRVSVPSPQRYALHKLLVSERRTGAFASKARKDLKQAEWLIKVLAQDRPHELRAAWEDLSSRGKGWRRTAESALAKVPEARAALFEVVGNENCMDHETHPPMP